VWAAVVVVAGQVDIGIESMSRGQMAGLGQGCVG